MVLRGNRVGEYWLEGITLTRPGALGLHFSYLGPLQKLQPLSAQVRVVDGLGVKERRAPQDVWASRVMSAWAALAGTINNHGSAGSGE